MPRSFDLVAESPNSAPRILSTFRDERYWRARLAAFGDGRHALDSLTTATDGTTTVTMTLRFGLEGLPPPVNRLHHGTVRVVYTESWQARDDGSLDGTVVVDAPGTPMSGHGELAVTPTATGSRLTGRGTVDVRVPVVGGMAAGLLAGQLAAGIREIHEFTDVWIAQASP